MIKLSEIITLPKPVKVVKCTAKDNEELTEKLIAAHERYLDEFVRMLTRLPKSSISKQGKSQFLKKEKR